MKELFKLKLDKIRFAKHKSEIEKSMAQKRQDVFHKPTRGSGVSEKEMRKTLAMADESYACHEAEKLYRKLWDAKVGPCASLRIWPSAMRSSVRLMRVLSLLCKL